MGVGKLVECILVTEAALAAGGFERGTSFEDVAAKPDEAVSVYIEASKIKDELEQKLKELSRLSSAIEPEIIKYFTEKGQQRVTRNGRTLYLAREIWPKIVDDDLVSGLSDERAIDDAKERARARLIEALGTDPETKHLVKATYNHQTLRSYILNDVETGEDGLPIMPEHLKGKLGVTEVFKAKVLKS